MYLLCSPTCTVDVSTLLVLLDFTLSDALLGHVCLVDDLSSLPSCVSFSHLRNFVFCVFQYFFNLPLLPIHVQVYLLSYVSSLWQLDRSV